MNWCYILIPEMILETAVVPTKSAFLPVWSEFFLLALPDRSAGSRARSDQIDFFTHLVGIFSSLGQFLSFDKALSIKWIKNGKKAKIRWKKKYKKGKYWFEATTQEGGDWLAGYYKFSINCT